MLAARARARPLAALLDRCECCFCVEQRMHMYIDCMNMCSVMQIESIHPPILSDRYNVARAGLPLIRHGLLVLLFVCGAN